MNSKMRIVLNFASYKNAQGNTSTREFFTRTQLITIQKINLDKHCVCPQVVFSEAIGEDRGS